MSERKTLLMINTNVETDDTWHDEGEKMSEIKNRV